MPMEKWIIKSKMNLMTRLWWSLLISWRSRKRIQWAQDSNRTASNLSNVWAATLGVKIIFKMKLFLSKNKKKCFHDSTSLVGSLLIKNWSKKKFYLWKLTKIFCKVAMNAINNKLISKPNHSQEVFLKKMDFFSSLDIRSNLFTRFHKNRALHYLNQTFIKANKWFLEILIRMFLHTDMSKFL